MKTKSTEMGAGPLKMAQAQTEKFHKKADGATAKGKKQFLQNIKNTKRFVEKRVMAKSIVGETCNEY